MALPRLIGAIFNTLSEARKPFDFKNKALFHAKTGTLFRAML